MQSCVEPDFLDCVRRVKSDQTKRHSSKEECKDLEGVIINEIQLSIDCLKVPLTNHFALLHSELKIACGN